MEVAGFAEVEAEVTVVEGVMVMLCEVGLALVELVVLLEGRRILWGAEITLEAAEAEDDPAAVMEDEEDEEDEEEGTLMAENFTG